MRLFIAINIPDEIRSSIARLLTDLRAVAPQVKWIRPENLHITLKFLGETSPGKVAAIQRTLDSIRYAQPITLEIRDLGFFPNAKRPRVFWAGIQRAVELQTIASEINNSLHVLGFALDDRPFTPHLTLARFTQPGLPPALQASALDNATRSFGAFTAREFHLIESKLKSTGAEYTIIQTFSFAPEA